MSKKTAATDAAEWFQAWSTAYRAEREVGGTPSPMNAETLMSYYQQGSISSSSEMVEFEFHTRLAQEYTMTLVCSDASGNHKTRMDYVAPGNNGVVLAFNITWEN